MMIQMEEVSKHRKSRIEDAIALSTRGSESTNRENEYSDYKTTNEGR